MVAGHSTVISARRGPLLFTLAVSMCFWHVSGGGPVAQFKLDWLFPWNVSCTTCGPPDPTLNVHCRQLRPMYPFGLHCKVRFTPRVDVLAAQLTAVTKLDGTFIGSSRDGHKNEPCPDIGVGPCPWFANETYSGEITRVWGGNIKNAPKGHYELKGLVTNQDGVTITCISCQVDVKYYLNNIVTNY